MDLKIVAEAVKAVESLKSSLPEEVYMDLSLKVSKALEETMGLKNSISDPLPVDVEGKLAFKSLDKAIKRYVDERDALRLASAAFNKVEEEAKDRMNRISMWLRDKGDELGVDSFKSQFGTAYRSVKTKYQMADWTSFISWVEQTKNFQCLEKRVAKLATKEIHDGIAARLAEIDEVQDENTKSVMLAQIKEEFGVDPEFGGVPPGINYSAEVEFDVRRPTKAGEKE